MNRRSFMYSIASSSVFLGWGFNKYHTKSIAAEIKLDQTREVPENHVDSTTVKFNFSKLIINTENINKSKDLNLTVEAKSSTNTDYTYINSEDVSLDHSTGQTVVNSSNLKTYNLSNNIDITRDLNNITIGDSITYQIRIKIKHEDIDMFNITGGTITLEKVESDSELYNFTSFDTNKWELYSNATYEQANDNINMVNGNNQNGELVYSDGIQSNNWFIEWENEFVSGNHEFQKILFYTDTINKKGNGNDYDGISSGYEIEVDWDTRVYLREINNGSVNQLEKDSTTKSTHTYRVEYNNGTIKFYIEGNKVIDYTLANPNTNNNKLYFKSVTGTNSSTNNIDDVLLSF